MRSFGLIAALLVGGCSRSDTALVDALSHSSEHDAALSNLKCQPESMNTCVDGICNSTKPNITLFWKPKEQKIGRCNSSSCDYYKVVVSHSGAFTNISLPANGMLVRIGEDGMYTEVVTLGLMTIVYNGRCKSQRSE